MVLVLTMVVLQSISFANYALTTKTTNIIQGSAPYLTFDGGRTRVTETFFPNKLHWISLSDGRKFDGGSIRSDVDPIILPVAGQSFEDIDMVVPKNADSIELSSLIGEPYNYWGDDDGDGQGIDGITATGSINLSIVDRKGQPVARNEVLDICKAPYILTLSNTDITLKTRYGIPNERFIHDSYIIYYINPKVESQQQICVAKPNMRFGGALLPDSSWIYKRHLGPASMWNPNMGFLTQSFTPSSYDLNFPTTGANNLSFDLEIGGVRHMYIDWEVITSGDIKATITRSSKNSSTSITVTLTGPAITDNSQKDTNNPSPIGIPSLPQAFEIVGKMKDGGRETGVVVKYGFVLKQWFVNRQKRFYTYRDTSTWCTKVGYRMPTVKDLTNASCKGEGVGNPYYCEGSVGATPSAPNNYYTRHIGAGFFSEWGKMQDYSGGDFHGGRNYDDAYYWTSDRSPHNAFFVVNSNTGAISVNMYSERYGVCVYP
ncbi:hypothetical protein [Gilliamella apis]|uniref:hypothetical protein n=1 Tax=Gilliamella apis TaxID=1970738 RepID=UPI001055E637|nr:hypothetical protein [Gilliamella apis]